MPKRKNNCHQRCGSIWIANLELKNRLDFFRGYILQKEQKSKGTPWF